MRESSSGNKDRIALSQKKQHRWRPGCEWALGNVTKMLLYDYHVAWRAMSHMRQAEARLLRWLLVWLGIWDLTPRWRYESASSILVESGLKKEPLLLLMLTTNIYPQNIPVDRVDSLWLCQPCIIKTFSNVHLSCTYFGVNTLLGK